MQNPIKWLKNKLGITKLDDYIIGKFISTFLFGMMVFILIIVIFDISEKLDNLIKAPITILNIVFDYYVNFILFYASALAPLIIFLSVIFFTAKMADNTEVVPILSAGISFNRYLYPYIVVSCILAVGMFLINSFVIPPAIRTKLDFENRYVRTKYEFKGRNNHYRLDKNTYVYIESYDIKDSIGYRFSLEKFSGDTLKYKMLATSLKWNNAGKNWIVREYSIRHINGLIETMEKGAEMPLNIAITPRDFERKDDDRGTMTLTQLNKYIKREQLRGTGTVAKYEMERYRLFLTPLAIFILVIMGVSLSSKKVRGGIGLPLGIGIGLCFMYIILIQFSEIFSVKGGIPTWIAAIIPHFIFGSITFYLYKIAPK